MPKYGGTLTVSNVDAIGAGDSAFPLLVPGEKLTKVGTSWSGDHRVVEGAELAAFVDYRSGYVEVPQRIIGI
jgi:2-oxoisovalerate dehydrogenase E2 component (dihydrolipoyl transacylase)